MDTFLEDSSPLACPICFNASEPKASFREAGTHSWDNVDRCDAHGVCQPCMQRWVELKILDEGLWHIRCPGDGCRYRLVMVNVRDALAQSTRREEAVGKLEQIRGEDCASRLRSALKDALEDESQALLLQDCQACPRCFVLTFRADGCLHLACRCGADFCYGCGAPHDLDDCMCDLEEVDGSARLACWLSTCSPIVEDLRPALLRIWSLNPKTWHGGSRRRSWVLAWQEEAEDRRRRQQPQTLVAFLPVAVVEAAGVGEEIEAVRDPQDRYGHRMDVGFWDFDGNDDYYDLEPTVECDLDEVRQSALSAKAWPRREHGAPLQFRTVKAWVRPAEGSKHQRQQVTVPTQPRRQRNALGAGRLAQETVRQLRRAQQLQRVRRVRSAGKRDCSSFNEEEQGSLCSGLADGHMNAGMLR
mmetsp:Transcript_130142/g.417624  ORF Transcript_130142/g.417624 Transcript_130142/m.417624 type:complete len:415 (+) Transcript_130142:70-1314(+)